MCCDGHGGGWPSSVGLRRLSRQGLLGLGYLPLAHCPLRIGKVSWEAAGGEMWGRSSSASCWAARPRGGLVGVTPRALLSLLVQTSWKPRGTAFMSYYLLLFLKGKKKKSLKGGFKPRGSPGPTLRTTSLGQFLGVQEALTPGLAQLCPWQAAGPVTGVLGGFGLPLGGRALPVGGGGSLGTGVGTKPCHPFCSLWLEGRLGVG